MTALFLFFFVILLGLVSYTIFKKKKPSTLGAIKPSIKIIDKIKIPTKKDQLAFVEFSPNLEDDPKEVVKSVTKWDDFKFLYLKREKHYINKQRTKLATGIYVVGVENDNKKYLYYVINNGDIIEQNVRNK